MPNQSFYRSTGWKKLRLQVLRRDHWYCQSCTRSGRPFVPANTVHHKVPVEAAPALIMDPSNLESICPACHNKAHPEKAFRKRKAKMAMPTRARIIKM